MEKTCTACGAIYPDQNDCETLFNQFLALEFTDFAYGKVHFLTVACYMIQHGRYSDEGQAWIKEQLRRHIEDGIPVETIRQDASHSANNANRRWKVSRSADIPPPPRTAWSMTIADVARHYLDAESYCNLIHQWAKVTLAEMP